MDRPDGHTALVTMYQCHASYHTLLDVRLIGGSLVKTPPGSLGSKLCYPKPAHYQAGDIFYTLMHIARSCVCSTPECSTARKGGMPVSPCGGPMPDDRAVCALQTISRMTSVRRTCAA
jgi:hypothetical protein